jgi:magnesium transporter
MPIAFRPRLPRRARARRAGVVAPAAERTQPQIERLSLEGLDWIHIEQPGALERAWLAEHYEFHALDLEDVMSRNQRPKIDEYPDYLFIVLHFPVFDKQVGRLNAGELDLFVGPDFVITLPNQPLKPVEYLFERCRTSEETREQLFSKGPGYLLYQIVDQSFDYCFPMLRKIGNKLEQLEEEIFSGRSEEVVRDISNVKQEIINFRKTIRPERTVLRDLERTKQRYMREDMEVYFDDIVDASERIWDMLENYKEVVEALEDTNESVLSHRVNDVLRVLTSISVIVLPLTFLASLWGMNVGVPGEDSVAAFWIIAGVMVAMLAGMIGYFRHRGWLYAAAAAARYRSARRRAAWNQSRRTRSLPTRTSLQYRPKARRARSSVRWIRVSVLRTEPLACGRAARSITTFA